jgi:hypothetical protein
MVAGRQAVFTVAGSSAADGKIKVVAAAGRRRAQDR